MTANQLECCEILDAQVAVIGGGVVGCASCTP